MSLLMICAIVGLFLNMLTADDKHCLRSSKNVLQPIQMQLSKKRKTLSQFFAEFPKFTSSFEETKPTLLPYVFL